MEMKNNEQHAIDITVRQALENLEIPYQPDHWQAMAAKLDALDVAESGFDKQVSDKLSRLEIPLNTGHWALMADKLVALDADEMAFDNNLAAKLASIEVPYKAASWADMSARLDDLDNAETRFDALLSQRLQNLEVKYQPKHWDMMADKIEQTFSWRAKIMRYKVIEVALVLLTLYTAGNMLDLPFDFTKESGIEKTIEGQEAKGKGQEARGNEQEAKGNEQGAKGNEQEARGKRQGARGEGQRAKELKAKEIKTFYPTDWRTRSTTPSNNTNTKGQPIVATDDLKGELTPNTVVTQLFTANSEDKVVAGHSVGISSSQASELPINTEGVTLAALPTKKVTVLGRVVNSDEGNLLVGADAIAAILNPVDVLSPSLLNTDFYDENVTFPIHKEKRAKWRLNIFGAPSADKVLYNYVKDRVKVTEKQIASNLGTGIAVGYKHNKLEVEAGLTYQDKKYDLPNIELIRGSFLRGGYTSQKPQNLHLSIVSIPLSVNYIAKETRRWSFYTRVGAAFNAIFKTKEEQFLSTSEPTAPQQLIANSQQIDVNKYELNIYPSGIVNDAEGSNSLKIFTNINAVVNKGLKVNSYLTANAALGVEYRLTRKTDIYLQPTFDYMFSKRGIGTLNDRIHSFSVQGGVKTKLK
jgi:hypothetical protein